MAADAGQQLVWQRRAAAVLGGLLERAAREDLPALSWTVHNAGCALTGRSLARPPARRRGDLEAWAAALGITLDEYGWRGGGGSVITGVTEQATFPEGTCAVILTANIYDEDGDTGGDPDRAAPIG